jgi:hypothetical protein
VSFGRGNDTLLHTECHLSFPCLSVSLTVRPSGRGVARAFGLRPPLPPPRRWASAAQRPRVLPRLQRVSGRDVDRSRVHCLAGSSIAANHWSYRCNAIRSTLAIPAPSQGQGTGPHQDLTEVWTYTSHNFSLSRRREKVIAESLEPS